MSALANNLPTESAGSEPLDAIRLVVPARREFIGVARTAASALAFGCGLAALDVDCICDAVDVALSILNELRPKEAAELRFEPGVGRLALQVEALHVPAGLSLSEQFGLGARLGDFVSAITFNDAGTCVGFQKETSPHAEPAS